MFMDPVIAASLLVSRSGGQDFEFGYTCPHQPGAGKGHSCSELTWWASAKWKGTKVLADGHKSPPGAAITLAVKILMTSRCKCGRPVVLDDESKGCRWKLMGERWVAGCDDAPISIPVGAHGDLIKMSRAADAKLVNREQRRHAERARRRSGPLEPPNRGG